MVTRIEADRIIAYLVRRLGGEVSIPAEVLENKGPKYKTVFHPSYSAFIISILPSKRKTDHHRQ